jgi:hypothetical protein
VVGKWSCSKQSIGGWFMVSRLSIPFYKKLFPLLIDISDYAIGFNLILCYYGLGDREKMKKTFQKLLSIDLGIDDEDKYTATQVSMPTVYSYFKKRLPCTYSRINASFIMYTPLKYQDSPLLLLRLIIIIIN